MTNLHAACHNKSTNIVKFSGKLGMFFDFSAPVCIAHAADAKIMSKQ